MIELWKKEHFPYSRLEELYLVSYGLFVKHFQEYRVAKCRKSRELVLVNIFRSWVKFKIKHTVFSCKLNTLSQFCIFFGNVLGNSEMWYLTDPM